LPRRIGSASGAIAQFVADDKQQMFE